MALPGVYPAFQHWCKNTVWLYSDPHFGDKDLAKSIKKRPSDEAHIARINSCVGKRDTLIILGDVGDIECVRQLKGYKVLIMGNHDVGRSNYERKVIKEIYDQDKISRDEVITLMKEKYPNWRVWVEEDYDFHSPFLRWNAYADNCLFDEVYEGALIIGEKIILSHEPVEISWLWNFHGHDHSGTFRPNHTNACSDVIGYKPIHLNTVLQKFGISSKVTSIHRETIDGAIERKRKRGGKKIGEKTTKAEWRCKCDENGNPFYHCTNCGDYVKPGDDRNYCPTCGVKMKGASDYARAR